jgi:hypothetical protein
MKTVSVVGTLDGFFLLLFVACSGMSEQGSGAGRPTPAQGGSATGGDESGGSSGSNTSSAGAIGEGGTSEGGSTGSTLESCRQECSVFGQLCEPNSLTCYCPNYAPDHCPDEALCTDLSDEPDHCGACGNACPLTSACTPEGCTAEPEEIYSCEAGLGPLYLATAGSNLYWVEPGAGTVSSLDLAGGGQVIELASGLDGGRAIALDGMNER